MANKKQAAGDALKQKKEQSRREDILFNRMLVAFGVALVVEIALIVLYRSYYSGADFGRQLGVAALVFAGAAAALAVTAVAGFFKGRTRLAKGALAALVVCGVVAAQLWLIVSLGLAAIKLGCIIFPVLLLLYIIYIIYQPEFFITALLSALGVFAVWYSRYLHFRSYNSRRDMLYILAALLLLFAAVTLVSLLKKGVVTLGKRRITLFRPNTNYIILFATYVIVAVLAAIYEFLEPGAFNGVVAAFGVYAFVSAIYHTVKLM